MQDLVALDRPPPPRVAAPTAASRPWSCARYLEALHPQAGRGKVSFLARRRDAFTAHTCGRDVALAAAGVLIDSCAAYVAMNPFHGPRGDGRRLASLNALFVDLDVQNVPALAGLSRATVAGRITARIAALGLPAASVLVDSGRGFYAIWLLDGGHPAAESRWRAATRALVGLFAGFGADPACVDPARVLRLPESWHDGAGRAVAVIAGDGARHAFDALCDQVFVAAGRPNRETLALRRAEKKSDPKRVQRPAATGGRGRGLSRAAFGAAVQRDLDRLRVHWGGTIPVGRRDLWLHAYACALAWTDPGADIAEKMVVLAADAAPGLSSREVRTCAGTVARRTRDALAGRRGAGGADPRYTYAGSPLAERLGIDAGLAAQLGFEQIIPQELRAARRASARTTRRRAAGVLPRSTWLAQNSVSREKPWLAEGVSRATWQRRRKQQRERRVLAYLAGLRASAATPETVRETGAVWLYGGEASPAGAADEPSSPAIPAFPVTHPPRRPNPPPARPPRAIPRPDPVMLSLADAAALPVDPKRTDHVIMSAPSTPTPPCSQPLPDSARPEALTMPTLDPTVLAAAAARLSPTELGWLVRVVASPDGDTVLAELDVAARARITPWLCRADSNAILGVKAPDPTPESPRQRATRRLGGDLFDLLRPTKALAAPPIAAGAPAGGRSPTVKQAAIAEGVRLVMGAGKSEDSARRTIGALFRDLRDGVVCEAIAAAAARAHEIAEPVGWIRAYAVNNYGAAAARPQRWHKAPTRVGAAPPTPQPARPIATPEALGLSPERARKIREHNRLLTGQPRNGGAAPPRGMAGA